MADLIQSQLRLLKPAFWIICDYGRQTEWEEMGHPFQMYDYTSSACGLADKPRCRFLMALRRFIAHRGKPLDILSDQGTNFKVWERELKETFEALQPQIKEYLAN